MDRFFFIYIFRYVISPPHPLFTAFYRFLKKSGNKKQMTPFLISTASTFEKSGIKTYKRGSEEETCEKAVKRNQHSSTQINTYRLNVSFTYLAYCTMFSFTRVAIQHMTTAFTAIFIL